MKNYIPGFHAGGFDDENKVVSFDARISQKVEINGGNTDYEGSDDESYPSFTRVPVMIYIGTGRDGV